MKLVAAKKANLYASTTLNDVAKMLTCNNSLENKSCMYRECNNCKSKTIPVNPTLEMGKQVPWKLWRNIRVEVPVQNGKETTKVVTKTVKEEEQGTLGQLNDEIQVEANRFLRHMYNINHQYRAISQLKESLTDEELVLHIDFSENYQCKYHEEIQSIHFGASQQQISLHTGVAYTKSQVFTFTTASDCLKHSPSGIWAHLQPVLTWLKQKSNAKDLHVLSDGPTAQYRNRQNLFLFSTKLFGLGFSMGTWNFFEASHGKGAADGIGAAIKQQADRAVNVRSVDITCAKEMIDVIRNAGTSIEMFEVKANDIQRTEEEIPPKLNAVPDTMKIHQATSSIPSLQPIDAVDETLIGQYCVVIYDKLPYPGKVLDVDESDLQVQVMHRVSPKIQNKYFWPMLPDVCWYPQDKVITMLDSPPENISKRHLKICDKIWEMIEQIM